MTKEQYISQWHYLFTTYVNATLGFISERLMQANCSDEEKDKLRELKVLLEGSEVSIVNACLSSGIVTDDTLDNTEIVYSEISGFFIDTTVRDRFARETLKELARRFEKHQKERTKLQLSVLLSLKGVEDL